MKKHKTIGYRITKAVLMTCGITLIISALFSSLASIGLQRLLHVTGHEIGMASSYMSAEALLDQSKVAARDFMNVKVKVLDAYLKNIQDNLIMIGDHIENIYNSPHFYRSVSVPRFDAMPQGEMGLYYSWDSEISLSWSLINEINMLPSIRMPIETMILLNDKIFNVYFVTATGGVIFYNDHPQTAQLLIDNEIKLRERPWYEAAVENKGVSITDIYEDALGEGLCVTISVPVYRSNGTLAGVLGTDLRISDLSLIVSEITASGVDFAMLIGEERIIASSSVSEYIDFDCLPDCFEQVVYKRYGSFTLAGTCEDAYVMWETLDMTDWKLVLFIPIARIVAPALTISENISTLTGILVKDAEKIAMLTGLAMLIALVSIFIFGMYYSRKTSMKISTPLEELTKNAVRIGQGELEYLEEVNSGDEIESLAVTINKMVKEIKRIAGEKERISAELSIATQIQASMLPCIFPPFPDRKELDIYGTMTPAKEVGGDFYDFFFVDENRLAIVIADVSDKGVPAALFMMIAKTLIKSNAQLGKSPKETFEAVNDTLCENNDTAMFVTAFMGIWDMNAGVFTYVNAGHNPPLIKSSNEKFKSLPIKPGLVLAGAAGFAYNQDEIMLNEGDIIYLYTDGVTEAANSTGDLFTTNRLIDIVNRKRSGDLKELVDNVMDEIHRFTQGVEQSDDITMLVLKVVGKEKMKSLKVQAVLENLHAVQDFVGVEMEKFGCPAKLQAQLTLAIEEIFVNIVHYAYTPNIGDVVVKFSIDTDIIVVFEDSGKPYNPLENETPNLKTTADERQIGGLGIFMVKKVVEHIEYRYVDGKNVLMLRKEIR
jgi:sigma-B regulation protein RsbU (phosphoserine phosphatase)